MDNASVAGGLAVFSLIICFSALVSGYSFPLQRRFPSVVLVWVSGSDFMNALYYSIVLIPGPLQEHLNEGRHESICVFLTYFQIFLDLHSMLVCVVVAYTLYVIIGRTITFMDLERYYYRILAAIWATSLVFPFVSLIEIHTPHYERGVCFLNFRDQILFRVVPWAVLVLVQVRFILPVIRHTWNIQWAVRHFNTVNSVHLFSLYARYSGILLTQIIFRLITNVYILEQISNKHVPESFKNFMVFMPAALSVNSVVFLAGNKNLYAVINSRMNFIRGRIKETVGEFCGKNPHQMEEIQQEENDAINFNAENQDIVIV